MKGFLAAAALLSLAASSSFALVGGPWDSNVFGNPNKVDPSNYNGSYQGTIKGKNLSGIMAFGTSTLGATAIGSNVNSSQGYGVIYMEGKIVSLNVAVTLDLGARKIAGVLAGGGGRTAPTYLYNIPEQEYWTVTDTAEAAGSFTAKLSSNWASNSFSGKGSMMVTKVDIEGFALQVATTPATAIPLIVSVPTSFKVAGVKTSTNPTSYTITTTFVDPSVSAQPIQYGN